MKSLELQMAAMTQTRTQMLYMPDASSDHFGFTKGFTPDSQKDSKNTQGFTKGFTTRFTEGFSKESQKDSQRIHNSAG